MQWPLTERGSGRLAVHRLLPVLKGQQRFEPGVQVLLGLQHDAETVILGVQGDDVLVLGVVALVDVEARPERDAAFRRQPVVELLLRVVVLEPGRGFGRLGPQHEPLLAGGLEFLQQAASHHLTPPVGVQAFNGHRSSHVTGTLTTIALCNMHYYAKGTPFLVRNTQTTRSHSRSTKGVVRRRNVRGWPDGEVRHPRTTLRPPRDYCTTLLFSALNNDNYPAL